VRILNLIDEYTRECLMIRAARRWSSAKVIGALADLRVIKGDGRTTARSSSRRTCASGLVYTGAKTQYIEPGSPWENGYYEGFNSKLRDSSSILRFSTRSNNFAFWPNAGAFTTTPSDHTPRWGY
jgi:putative transposase